MRNNLNTPIVIDQFNSSRVLLGTSVSGTSCVFCCADALSARCSQVLSSRLRNDARAFTPIWISLTLLRYWVLLCLVPLVYFVVLVRCSEVLSSRLRNDARRLHLGVTVTKGRRQRNVTSRNQDRPGLFVCLSAGPQTTPGVIARKILTSPPCRWELWLGLQKKFWYLKYLPSDNVASGMSVDTKASRPVLNNLTGPCIVPGQDS